MSLKVGRPALGAAKRRRLSMTLKPELVGRLETLADREGLSTSRLAEGLLEQAVDQERLPASLWEARLGVTQAQTAALCRALGIRRLGLFGSVLTDRFGPGSDVDLLVEFKPGVVRTLLDRGRIQMEFETLCRRPVDLVELRLIDNPLKRREIQRTCKEIYAPEPERSGSPARSEEGRARSPGVRRRHA